MYKNEKFSFKLMISVNGYTEKPTSKDKYRIYNQLLLNILRVISQKYGHNL